MKIRTAAAALIVAATPLALPAPAHAGPLCAAHISCGQIIVQKSSTYAIDVKCGNGSWHKVKPGKRSTSVCRDVNKFKAVQGRNTWLYRPAGPHGMGPYWQKLKPGYYGVTDVNTLALKAFKA